MVAAGSEELLRDEDGFTTEDIVAMDSPNIVTLADGRPGHRRRPPQGHQSELAALLKAIRAAPACLPEILSVEAVASETASRSRCRRGSLWCSAAYACG
uniref:Uncharacterized protein n=1 Tax=Oryza meridionalis TaxID=40149 RepID=A0A0E0F6P1_9ORYZ